MVKSIYSITGSFLMGFKLGNTLLGCLYRNGVENLISRKFYTGTIVSSKLFERISQQFMLIKVDIANTHLTLPLREKFIKSRTISRK